MAVWVRCLVITKPWPWGHLVGNCFSFSMVLSQSERRKIRIFTSTVSSPDIVNWGIPSCCCRSNAHLSASVTLFTVSTRLSYPCGVALASFGCLTLPTPDLRCIGMNLHRFVFVKIQRKVEGYISLPADSIEEQPQIVVWNRILQNVLSHWVALERGSRNYRFDSLEAGWQETANRHWHCGDPGEQFDREGHSVFPDIDITFLPTFLPTILQSFPGRPCPDKNLNGNAYYGGNEYNGNHSTSWLSSFLFFLLTHPFPWVLPIVLYFLFLVIVFLLHLSS